MIIDDMRETYHNKYGVPELTAERRKMMGRGV
jgi:hypothetical protein